MEMDIHFIFCANVIAIFHIMTAYVRKIREIRTEFYLENVKGETNYEAYAWICVIILKRILWKTYILSAKRRFVSRSGRGGVSWSTRTSGLTIWTTGSFSTRSLLCGPTGLSCLQRWCGYLSTLSAAQITSNWWIMNWKRYWSGRGLTYGSIVEDDRKTKEKLSWNSCRL